MIPVIINSSKLVVASGGGVRQHPIVTLLAGYQNAAGDSSAHDFVYTSSKHETISTSLPRVGAKNQSLAQEIINRIKIARRGDIKLIVAFCFPRRVKTPEKYYRLLKPL